MLKQRFITALIGIPILLFLIYQGGLFVGTAVIILVVLGLREFWQLLRGMDLKPLFGFGYLCGLLLVGGTYLYSISYDLPTDVIGLVLTGVIFLLLIGLIFAYPGFSAVDMATTLFGVVYIGWLFSHLILLRHTGNGFLFVLLALVLNWATDTSAYFIGCRLGRHKLHPALSPNKTWEGALGGIAGSILVGLIFQHFLGIISVGHVVIISLLVGVFAQIGDLAESALKRLAGVKDSGRLVPGHGGVLDRFDSVLLTLPMVYYYLNLIPGVR